MDVYSRDPSVSLKSHDLKSNLKKKTYRVSNAKTARRPPATSELVHSGVFKTLDNGLLRFSRAKAEVATIQGRATVSQENNMKQLWRTPFILTT